MGAPKGNEYYKLRFRDGRLKQYETPEELWEAATDYFQYVDDNPFEVEEIVKYRDSHTKDTVKKQRPYTMEGLYIHLGISHTGFNLYEERKDFVAITTHIRQIIRNQKFEGATAGLFQPMIIARDLGLRDVRDVNLETQRKTIEDLYPKELTEGNEEDQPEP